MTATTAQKQKFDLSKLKYFIRLMTVEPYVFLFLFAYVAQRIPIDQLTQDKICRQKYGLDINYCLKLPTMTEEEDSHNVKSSILVDVTRFNMIAQVIVTVPSMFTCLFVGPFIDKYHKAKKFLILLSSVMITLETSLLILNCYFFDLDYRLIWLTKILPALFSYPMVPFTAVWCYVSAVTPIHLRAIRMVTVELFLFAATPVGTALAGIVLNLNPMFTGRELRNFSGVFSIGVGFSILSFFAAWFMVNEETDRKLYLQHFPAEEENEKDQGAIEKGAKLESINDSKPEIEETNPVKIFFNIKNVQQMFRTCFKSRPHNIRLQLFLMLFAGMLYVFCYQGSFVFMYQYVQRVFNWNSQKFSLYMSFSFLWNVVSSLIFAPVLIKVLKLSDLNLSLVSMVILFFQYLTRSIGTHEWNFLLSTIFCALNLIGSIGIRAYISKVVAPHELGSIYSIMSFMEQLSPLLTATILSGVFSFTIDTMPTAAFILLAFLVLVDIISILIVSYYSGKTLKALKDNPL